jgi:hypothetical protein
LLDTRQAAEFLRVRPQTLSVWRMSRRYALAYVKVGTKVFYRLRDLQAFLDRQTVTCENQ